ncbi:MAG TPA: barstar family protein [Candidatus Nitrosocosmicus sp.]|nr:barstar family protein [Candidatus Nitrosocosmicus sp.]
MKNRKIYIIPGEKVTSLEAFWKVIGESINGPDGYFGGNFDAFNDCLGGGFGTPDNESYIIRWENVKMSKQALGYKETLRYFERSFESIHESWCEIRLKEIELAKKERGKTIFGILIDIITDADNVELQLVLSEKSLFNIH